MYMSTSIFSMYQWPHFGRLVNCCQCQFGFALSHAEFVFMLQSSSLCKQTIIQFLGRFPLLCSLSICSELVPHICQINSLPRSIANRLPHHHSQLLSHTPRHFSASLPSSSQGFSSAMFNSLGSSRCAYSQSVSQSSKCTLII